MLKKLLGLSLLVGSLIPATQVAAQEVSRAELARVRYELSKVEDSLNAAGGKPIELSANERKAFTMVRELAERDKDNPDVQKLVEEAKKLYNDAKGVRFEITPEMIAYRSRQKDLSDQLGEAADQQWKELLESKEQLKTTFPISLPPDIDPDDILGKSVVLPEVSYEKSLFVQMGRNWIPVGDATKGFYFVDGSGPAFTSLFLAMQRYRNQVKEQVEEKWTVVCQLESPGMLAPDGTDQRAGTPHLGWIVQPTAIYLPGQILVYLDETAEDGATFAGEDKLGEMQRFTVTEVPDDVQPMELVRIYITALKEKNWDLHLECLNPDMRSQGTQLQGLRYNWEIQQKGLEKYHAHAEPVEMAEIKVTSGFVDDDLESFFGDEDSKVEPALPKQEKTVVTVRLFDERGVQTVRPRYVSLVRNEEGRWYIWLGATLLF